MRLSLLPLSNPLRGFGGKYVFLAGGYGDVMSEPKTTAHYLPWCTATLEDGRIAIMNGLGDTICVSRDKAAWQDKRDFKSIVELANAQQT